MDKFLAHLGRVVIGVVGGTFLIAAPLSLIIEPTMYLGVGSGLAGVGLFYGFLKIKDSVV